MLSQAQAAAMKKQLSEQLEELGYNNKVILTYGMRIDAVLRPKIVRSTEPPPDEDHWKRVVTVIALALSVLTGCYETVDQGRSANRSSKGSINWSATSDEVCATTWNAIELDTCLN